MDTRKNEYLQNLSDCWQNNNKFKTIIQCEETLHTLMLWSLNHLVILICIYVLWAIITVRLTKCQYHSYTKWSFFNKFGKVSLVKLYIISLPCPCSACIVSVVIFWMVLCLVFTYDQRSLLIFTKSNFEKFS